MGKDRLSYAAKALFVGLAIAQALATLQVYLSNLNLYVTLVVLRGSGYLIVPNQKIMASLREFGPAWCGGMSFALSVGAGISLLSLASAWIWERLFYRKRVLLLPFVLFWVGLLAATNSEGLCAMVSSYFIIIPPVVFAATCRWMPPPPDRPVWLKRLAHALPFSVLAVVWATQMDGTLFVDVRDSLLLSNPLGMRVNDFYYDYTLYSAEAFKSLDQRLFRTCDLEDLGESPLARSLEQALLGHDYLPVRGESGVDLKIRKVGDGLAFLHRGDLVLRTTASGFLGDPGKALLEFSVKTDRYGFFRRFTFISLAIGLPITLFVLLYSLLRLVLSFFLALGTAGVTAAVLCSIIGLAPVIPISSMRGAKIDPNRLADALQAPRWQERVAALKFVETQGLEIGNFPVHRKLTGSPYVAERYWLARALGVSRQPETYREIIQCLDDPHPNVVAMAFYALGQRGDPGAVDEIKRRLKISAHWYSQWYGYKALRTLGWKQAAST
jgi:HEAT repeats